MNRSQLVDLLKNLKLRGLSSLKAEYESEGSTDEDIFFLKEVCILSGLGLHVKIGGVEARRDFRRCLIIGVDGIIAPMVENAFCGSKFIDMYKNDEQFYGADIWEIHRSINIETRYAVSEIDDIINKVGDDIHNITIGRSDLSGSYFDEKIKQDSDQINRDIETVIKSIQNSGKNISLTVGGGVTSKTIRPILENDYLISNIKAIETRKCMIDSTNISNDPSIIDDVLEFEMAYLDNRVNSRHTLDTYADKARLEELTKRLIDK
ncbi:aldolase/citrate lyase family protein [Gammaproteobacteria bacterium]|nr:aldolase/citrate lyase family protein [Gammaproteobacteria bacterium]